MTSSTAHDMKEGLEEPLHAKEEMLAAYGKSPAVDPVIVSADACIAGLQHHGQDVMLHYVFNCTCHTVDVLLKAHKGVLLVYAGEGFFGRLNRNFAKSKVRQQ